ncbi:MAG: GNAT family N-acetyltransferase [Ignavibacteriaceae bacterium]|nr:GNAT family N-acetyltransferase [Ignavibacteriaceae bacterium]
MKNVSFTQDLLPAVAKMLRSNMERDIMPDFLLREKTFGDPDFAPELTEVLIDDDQNIAAFIMGVVRQRDEGPMGYVKLFAVGYNYRRMGYGTKLLSSIEAKFRAAGVSKVRLFESWANYYMPGVDPFYTEAIAFFERNGYKKFNDTSNLSADLTISDFDTSDEEKALEADSIQIKRAEPNEKDEILDWIDSTWKAWHGEVEAAFRNDPVSLHIAKIDGKVRAFSAYECNNIGTGWFGPMGTGPEFRGKGVGGILLKRCLADLKRMGYVKAIIPWVGPIPFYMHHCGSKVSRVFWRYEKEI